MDDVQGDFKGPPHGTTPAAVIANRNKLRTFNSNKHILEKVMDHTAVSATLASSADNVLEIETCT